MLILEDKGVLAVEEVVQRAIDNHLELAAHWREKYSSEAYEVFDQLALRHEAQARVLVAGWRSIVGAVEGMEKAN